MLRQSFLLLATSLLTQASPFLGTGINHQLTFKAR